MPLEPPPRRLRILIHGLNYSPDVVGVAKYTTEMAAWLARRGHIVRVVTAPPYYPAWAIAQGYDGGHYTTETVDGIEILRCPLWVPQNPSGLKRILHLASFGLSSFPAVILATLRFRPDIIWTVQPALLAVPGPLLAAKLFRARSWMHVQDLEIDAAFQLGLLKSARSRRWALKIHRMILRAFDRVSSISPRMCETLIAQGAEPERTSLIWNWVDTDRVTPDEDAGFRLREALGIPGDVPVALYSGSMGNKQGLSIIIDAARHLTGRKPGMPRVQFVLCGEGSYRDTLKELAHGLDNILFLDLQPLERFSALLSLADIHLLPQRADAEDLVLPSKLGGMMASARPIIATAHPGTTLASVVTSCGVVVPPEDADTFTQAITSLAQDRDRRILLGAKGRAMAQQDWSTDRVLTGFEEELQRMVPT